jgi:hypothetical protein
MSRLGCALILLLVGCLGTFFLLTGKAPSDYFSHSDSDSGGAGGGGLPAAPVAAQTPLMPGGGGLSPPTPTSNGGTPILSTAPGAPPNGWLPVRPFERQSGAAVSHAITPAAPATSSLTNGYLAPISHAYIATSPPFVTPPPLPGAVSGPTPTPLPTAKPTPTPTSMAHPMPSASTPD